MLPVPSEQSIGTPRDFAVRIRSIFALTMSIASTIRSGAGEKNRSRVSAVYSSNISRTSSAGLMSSSRSRMTSVLGLPTVE